MSDSEEERRMKKLRRDAKDKIEWDDEFEEKPPKGRHAKDSKKKSFD